MRGFDDFGGRDEDDESFVSIPIDGIEVETDKAIRIVIDDDKIWIPKSVCDEWGSTYVLIAEWWAKREGLD